MLLVSFISSFSDIFFFFFFQAEDGIRVFHVTGVQTCALPIFVPLPTDVRNGFVVVTSLPKFDPVCSTGVRRQPAHLRKCTMQELSPKSSGKNLSLLSPAMTLYAV